MHLYSTPPCSTLSPKIKIFGDPLYADYRFFMLAWFIWDSVSGLYKNAGATTRSTKWYIVNDQMVNELIFDILDYRNYSSPVI